MAEVPPSQSTLEHAHVWLALYNAVNQQGLEGSNLPTIPPAVLNQGRIPVPVARFIHLAYRTGSLDARTNTIPASNFPVPDGDHDGMATAVLECYYQQGYSYIADHAQASAATIAAATAAAPAVAAPPHAVPVPIPTSQEPRMKINAPEEFSGDRNKFDKFRAQLALSFAANPAQFEDERAKIVFAASFLRGPAADWWVPKLNVTTAQTEFTTFPDFLQALRAAFDDPDATTTFAFELQRCRQGKKTVSEYYAKFLTLAARLDWNETTLVHHFKQGLAHEIKQGLVYDLGDQSTMNRIVTAA